MLSKHMRMLGACIRKRLGAKHADVGCKSAATFGCKVCGCWVQSMRRRLGASMRLLGASFITAESLPDSR